MNTKAMTIGAGTLLVLAVGPGAALALTTPTPAQTDPPPPAVVSELLARGAAGAFRINDTGSGVRLQATQPTDLALVKATLAPGRSTGWHGHTGPSLVIVTSGTLKMVEPAHRRHGPHSRTGWRCTTEAFVAGQAFAHPSHVHNFINDTADPVVFHIAYLVPAGASPAPIPADVPAGCRP
jgi:hypothetical protein